MESITGTLLGDIFKSFPKLINPALIPSYSFLNDHSTAKNPESKFQKPTKSSNEEVYTGEVSNNQQRHGFGLLFIPSEGLYEGEFRNNLIQGKGRLFKPNLIYEGVFNDLELSQGKIYSLKENSEYEGEIKNFKAHGSGTITVKNSYSYKGEFKEGLKEGFGELIWANKDRYKGEFSKDKQHGKGEFVSSNGTCYQGDWGFGKMNGKGVLKAPGDFEYTGMFSGGLKQGQGTCKWADGKTFEGFWMKGKYDGFGKETNARGQVTEGIWRNGVFKFNNFETKQESEIITKPIIFSEESSDHHNASARFGLNSESSRKSKVSKEASFESIQSESSFKNKSVKNSGFFSKDQPVGSKEQSKSKIKDSSIRSQNREVPLKGDISEEIKIDHFAGDISGINEGEAKVSISEDKEEIEEMGPAIAEFVLAEHLSSKDRESKASKSRSSDSKNDDSIAEPGYDLKINLSKSEERKDDSIVDEIPLKKKTTSYNPAVKEKRHKIIIKKPQVVPLLEIRAKVKLDPLYQVSYSKMKALSVFEYESQDFQDTHLSSEWLSFDKEKLYKGYLNRMNLPCGNGVLLQRGRIYQGSFWNGKKHGLGRLITALGRVYEGYWQRGKKHGFGVFTSESETYSGDWAKGLYHGLGVLENSQGTYDGQFIYGICEGRATFYFPDGREFEGDFRSGVPHGFGNLKVGSTVTFDQWKEGLPKSHEVISTKKVTPILPESSVLNEEEEDAEDSSSVSEIDIPKEID